jgi:hypothetical protein
VFGAIAVATRAGRGATVGNRAVFGLADMQDFGSIAFVVTLGALGITFQHQIIVCPGGRPASKQPYCSDKSKRLKKFLHIVLPQRVGTAAFGTLSGSPFTVCRPSFNPASCDYFALCLRATLWEQGYRFFDLHQTGSTFLPGTSKSTFSFDDYQKSLCHNCNVSSGIHGQSKQTGRVLISSRASRSPCFDQAGVNADRAV